MFTTLKVEPIEQISLEAKIDNVVSIFKTVVAELESIKEEAIADAEENNVKIKKLEEDNERLTKIE